MFELIGLAFATAVFFVIACGAGLLYAAIAAVIVQLQTPSNQSFRRTCWGVAAFLIPILSAVYVWLCVALLPGETLFGDIDQPLPNGFHLTALGKMPEYGLIEGERIATPRTDSLAVRGPLIAAQVCKTCNEAFTEGALPYLLIDTQHGKVTQFQSFDKLQQAFGAPVHFTVNDSFQSQESSYRRQKALDHRVMFTPPILVTLLYFALLTARRRESPVGETHLY